MDLERLTFDLLHCTKYTSHLVNSNEGLHSTVQHLTASLQAVQATLTEKDKQITELLKSTECHGLSVLEQLNELEDGKERVKELKRVKLELERVQTELRSEECRNREELTECEREREEDVKKVKEGCVGEVEEVKRRCSEEAEGLREEVRRCKSELVLCQKSREEELAQMRSEYESKLQAVQRAATTSLNIDIYKRKLGAQRSELMGEIERLRNELAAVQSSGRRGGRGFNSNSTMNRSR